MSATDDRTRHRERIAEVLAGAAQAKVGYPIRIRELEVVRTAPVTPSLLRVTLGGPGAAGFESHVADEHVRLVFPDPDTGTLRLPEPDGTMLRWPRPYPPSREYSVRRHDPEALEIDLEIVLHPGGLASGWAGSAAPGDRVHLAGPPGGLVVPMRYDRYLLAGDLTALPAIARWLETMPAHAAGTAVIEVPDAAHRIELERPPAMEIRWLDAGEATALADALRAAAPADGATTYLWAGGEATSLKAIRRWAIDELGLAASDRSITGYWKRGVRDYEDEHEHDH